MLAVTCADLFTSTDCPYFLRIRRINYALQINNEISTEIGHNREFLLFALIELFPVN